MFYLSDLIGKKVYGSDGKAVASIRDLVAEVLHSEQVEGREPEYEGDDGETVERDVPVVKGLLVKAGGGQPLFLSIKQIGRLDPAGTRLLQPEADLRPFERRAGELLLGRDLWDKQIIDLNSRRVVRVNDVAISHSEQRPEAEGPQWWIRGVDVGTGGLARRLRLSGLVGRIAPRTAQPRIVRWRHIDMFGSNVPGGVPLPHTKLADFHPVEIARITDAVSYHHGAEIISSLDNTLAADTLEEIADERRTDIIEHIPEERAADILEEMAPDEASDLLSDLPDDKARALLQEMKEEEAGTVLNLMRYAEHTAGGIMTTDFLRVLPSMTVDEVVEANRPVLCSADLIYYMYVIDSVESNRLVGIVTVRDLLVNDRDVPVGQIMLKEIISARPYESEKDVARKMAEYNLLALPVVDSQGVLAGVVTVDDALDALLPDGWKRRLPRVFS